MWNGNLCNTTGDIVVDSLLLVALVGAFIPQFHRIHTSSSTQGLSPYYILFNAFFNNAHLSFSLFLHAYGWPSERRPKLTAKSPVLYQIAKGRLHGIPAYGAILGLLQVFVLWCCSTTLVILFARHSTHDKPSGRKVSTQAFLHTAIVVLPAICIALPKPSNPSMGTDTLMALINMTNLVVAPLFAILQFYAQYRELRRQDGNPGALSLLSVFIQLLVTALVAYRWLLRLGTPNWPRGDEDLMPFAMWVWDEFKLYYMWGMIVWSYAIHAMGCLFLLVCYNSILRHQGHAVDAERTSLLA